MRIILKPGGILVLGLMLCGLFFAVFFSFQPKKAGGVSSAANSVGALAPAVLSGPNLLANGGFEGDFKPVSPDAKTKSHIRGPLATGWQDNSGWTDLMLEYAKESNNPHTGTSCQRITVSNIKNGQAQFVQYLKPYIGKTLQASVWLRGSLNQAGIGPEVQLVLRDIKTYNHNYGYQSFRLTSTWQLFQVTGKVFEKDTVMFMVNVPHESTVWVDDANVQIVGDTATSSPGAVAR